MPRLYPVEDALPSVISRFPSLPVVGAVSGRLTFVGGVCTRAVGGAQRPFIECACDCGKRKVIQLRSFVGGESLSCGCLGSENRLKATTFHGMSGTKEEHAFDNLKQRCNRPTHKAYPFYGGRGILCLYQDLAEFIGDVGLAPSSDMTLDRIDNSRHYEPGNCRWASRLVQQNNTRRNRFITYGGKTMTLAQWGRELGVAAATIRNRLVRRSVDEVFRELSA